jgi:hypothetical protein
MSNKVYYKLVFVLAFIARCQNTPTPVQNTQTPVVTKSDSTSTASPYGNFICPQVITPQQVSDVASGRLFYIDYDDYEVKFLDLQTMTSTPLIPEGEEMESYALSPDAKWLVYKSVNVSTSKEQLILTNTNKDEENKTTSLPWENDWDKVAYWLDNEQVAIKMYNSDKGYHYYRDLLLNPFSGEKQVLTADFPNQYITPYLLDWNGAGHFIYNSTLTRVFYAGEGNLIIWDVVNGKELARVPAFDLSTFHMQSPQWTLDGEKVLIAAPYNGEPNELFAVDQSGTVQKMTDLSSLHSYANRYGWSPDNRYIAMFIMLSGNERLAVLDTDTQKMDIYCIEGDTSLVTTFDYRGANNYGIDPNVYKAVVWSPDSRQLIMENRLSADSSRIILVDVEKRDAYEILNNVNYQPVGWSDD